MADTPARPIPQRASPNDPTAWAPPPGAATELGPAATPSTLPSGPGLKPAGTLTQLGNYKLISPLGEGGMSIVYKAYHAGLDRLYALKVMQATPQMPGGPIERFLREARSLAKVGKHPHIVQVHDVGNEAGCYYLAMDLIEGGPLDQRIRGTLLPPREAALIASQVADALSAAHAAGVIHRDLKPSNILLDAAGVPHVSDFGLARDMNAGVRLSQEGDVLGTPLYMAPEQIAGEVQRIGPRTDVYGLGATLYEMLAGQPPFPGDTAHKIWLLATTTEPAPPSRIRPAVPPDLETICLKAIEKLPTDRYSTAREMKEDLDRFLRGEPICARPIPWWMRVARRIAHHRAISVLVALNLCMLFSWNCMRLLDSETASRELERASALERGRKWTEARTAYLRVLAIEADSGEARAGLDRVDAEARREEAMLATREALRKARLVQGVLARWIPLAETLRTMERVAFTTGQTLQAHREAGRRAWEAVQEFIDATPDDETSQAVMRALAGWARVLAGYEDEGRAWMRQARELDRDLPYGAFVEALSWFSAYMARQPLPDIYSGEGGLRFGEPHAETPEMRRIREEVESLLGRAARAKVWGEGLAQDFQKAVAAMRAVQRGAYEEAERALTEAIASPTMEVFRTELLFARGKARYLQQRFDTAGEDLEKVRDVRSGWAEAWYFVAAVRAAQGMEAARRGGDGRDAFTKAVEAFSETLARDTRHVAALLGRGNTRQMLGDYDGAIADYESLMAIVPKEAAAWLNRGTIRYLRGEVEAAERDYDAAIERSATCTEAWTGKGLARARLGDADGAVRAFGEALRLSPDDEKALIERGEVKRRCGDQEGAHADFDRAARAHPGSADGLIRRGYSWARVGSSDKSLADFDAAVALDPRLAEAHAGRGMVLLDLGKVEDGLAALDTALALNPGHPEALVNRSVVKLRLGDKAGALADVDAAVRAVPDFIPAIQRRATLRLAEGDLGGAREDLERVLELAGPRTRGSGITAAHYDLACLYAQRAIGVERRGQAPTPVDPDRVKEWTGVAFGHLACAIEAGWRDRAHTEKDADLDPLHGDPRWKEVLERLDAPEVR